MDNTQDKEQNLSYKKRARERGTDIKAPEEKKHHTASKGSLLLDDAQLRSTKWKLRLYAVVDLLSDIAILLVIYLSINYFVISPFIVSGSSMETTLHDKEVILVDRMGYTPWFPHADPQRGDIIVLRPPIDVNEYYIKRVIGIPGDVLSFTKDGVYLNGKLLVEPYTNCRDLTNDSTSFTIDKEKCTYESFAHIGDIVVPEGHYFVMGDNRQHSSDSRACFSGSTATECPAGTSRFVPRENIVGRATSVIWPFDRNAVLGRATNFFDALWPINNPRVLQEYKITSDGNS